MRFAIPILILFLWGCQHASVRSLEADGRYGHFRGLELAHAQNAIVIIPQWHLSPGTRTDAPEGATLPQAENQNAIFHQLSAWIDADVLNAVVVEGCEGEITEAFTEEYNGWTLPKVKARFVAGENPDAIQTHIGLKLKARYGPRVRVVCGEELLMVKAHQLALSDLRGLLGFRLRVEQYKSQPERRRDYLDSIRKLLNVESASDEEVLTTLNRTLRQRYADFQRILSQRNSRALAEVRQLDPPVAIVIGALHVEDLRAQIANGGWTPVVLEPRGLPHEQDLMGELRQLIDTPRDPKAPGQ